MVYQLSTTIYYFSYVCDYHRTLRNLYSLKVLDERITLKMLKMDWVAVYDISFIPPHEYLKGVHELTYLKALL